MASTRLTPAERMCCTLLSELFLDIRLTPHDHFLTARALRRLDLPIDTIEHMLRYEIYPVLWTNLLNITGEWGGWDEDWLADQVEKWRENPRNLLYQGWLWLWWRYHEDYMMEHWNGIKKWLLFDKDDKVWSDKDTEKSLMEIEDEMLEADWVEVQKHVEGRRPFGETFGDTMVAIAGGFALAYVAAMAPQWQGPHFPGGLAAYLIQSLRWPLRAVVRYCDVREETSV